MNAKSTRPVTIWEARRLLRRIATRVEMAWTVADIQATALYLCGHSITAKRAAAVIAHDRALTQLERRCER